MSKRILIYNSRATQRRYALDGKRMEKNDGRKMKVTIIVTMWRNNENVSPLRSYLIVAATRQLSRCSTHHVSVTERWIKVLAL